MVATFPYSPRGRGAWEVVSRSSSDSCTQVENCRVGGTRPRLGHPSLYSGCRTTARESLIEAISSLTFEGMWVDALGSLGTSTKLRASKEAGVVSRGSESLCLLGTSAPQGPSPHGGRARRSSERAEVRAHASVVMGTKGVRELTERT